ncbi:MAG TPA: UPF0280 family protein [Alphaproteobacteria bacterium]|nr:UPF0280 family protein [Alphaproteobacteria bacterium]
MAGSAVAALLPDGRRLHLQHGPIDLVIEAFGAADEVRRAYRQAAARFDGLLDELVAELSLLRHPLGARDPQARGAVARRMVAACRPYCDDFITPMAAVAGAVADEVLAALAAGRDLARGYVNDGGDIALHLRPGERFRAGIIADVAMPEIFATLVIDAAAPVRGIATSGRATKGQGGRSFSRGIADSVTVLAKDGAAADAAATMVANAVDIDHPAIRREPARALDPDSDLGDILVTVAVGELGAAEIALALARGEALARRLREAGHIHGAVLTLKGACRVVGGDALRLAPPHAA